MTKVLQKMNTRIHNCNRSLQSIATYLTSTPVVKIFLKIQSSPHISVANDQSGHTSSLRLKLAPQQKKSPLYSPQFSPQRYSLTSTTQQWLQAIDPALGNPPQP